MIVAVCARVSRLKFSRFALNDGRDDRAPGGLVRSVSGVVSSNTRLQTTGRLTDHVSCRI